MDASNHIFWPQNLSALFTLWNQYPLAVPVAAGTALYRAGNDCTDTFELPESILSLEKIEEMRSITRTERYLEIGAMVRLSEIVALGKTVPDVFSRTLLGIASAQLRNLATIGGNICSFGDTIAPLVALDARFELRSAAASRWIPAIHFSTILLQQADRTMAKGELLTRIRIPLDEWNYTEYHKFRAIDSGGEGGVLILLVRNQKNVLSRIHVVFSGNTLLGNALLKDKNGESFLQGKALPLDKKDANQYRKYWENYLAVLEKPAAFLRAKIIHVIEKGILGLAE